MTDSGAFKSKLKLTCLLQPTAPETGQCRHCSASDSQWHMCYQIVFRFRFRFG